ncbi:MAG TPA: protein kinase [Polyangiaceae bacterium]
MSLSGKELKPGDVLGRYQLLMPIAKGGMGQVWAARLSGTRGFQKMVAVKTILPSNEDAGQLEAMLFEEASLASLIRHPNVAETLDLGEQNGALYLVMEWVNGEPLDFILRTARGVGGIPLPIAVHLIIQACKGLHAAHEARSPKGEPLGIVHRDISPQNLLVTFSGVVKLVDFGVAKATHQMTQPTQLGQVKGKFAYMSPEQVHGEKLDARADVFAMGIVLYRVTTGKHPYKSDNPAATIRNILTGAPALPSDVVPGYPKALEEVVMKALAKDKAMRFPSAHDMMLALEQALPAAMRAHSDKNTEVFLHRLFEKRIVERANCLQAALTAADAGSMKTRVKNPTRFPRSHSTMRAVSVDTLDTPGSLPSVKVTFQNGRRKWVARLFLAVAASLLLGVGFAALRRENVQPPDSVAAAANLRPIETSAPPAMSEAPPVAARPSSDPAPIAPVVEETAPVVPTTASPHFSPPKRLLRGGRRGDNSSGVFEVPSPAPAARPAPASESGAGDDPLNRRK